MSPLKKNESLLTRCATFEKEQQLMLTREQGCLALDHQIEKGITYLKFYSSLLQTQLEGNSVFNFLDDSLMASSCMCSVL